jgi:hypothetical protein
MLVLAFTGDTFNEEGESTAQNLSIMTCHYNSSDEDGAIVPNIYESRHAFKM